MHTELDKLPQAVKGRKLSEDSEDEVHEKVISGYCGTSFPNCLSTHVRDQQISHDLDSQRQNIIGQLDRLFILALYSTEFRLFISIPSRKFHKYCSDAKLIQLSWDLSRFAVWAVSRRSNICAIRALQTVARRAKLAEVGSCQ